MHRHLGHLQDFYIPQQLWRHQDSTRGQLTGRRKHIVPVGNISHRIDDATVKCDPTAGAGGAHYGLSVSGDKSNLYAFWIVAGRNDDIKAAGGTRRNSDAFFPAVQSDDGFAAGDGSHRSLPGGDAGCPGHRSTGKILEQDLFNYGLLVKSLAYLEDGCGIAEGKAAGGVAGAYHQVGGRVRLSYSVA